MRITILLAVLALAFYLFSCNTVFAKSEIIGQSLIYPTHPLYFLKAIRENLELKFATTSEVKTLRFLEFAHRRLRETNSLIKSSNEDLIPPTTERYWLHINSIKNLEEPKTERLNKIILEEISRHLLVLQSLYSQTENSRAKMALRAAIYRLSTRNAELLDILAKSSGTDQVKKFIPSQLLSCNFLLKESSSSALNQVERGVYGERAEKCFNEKNLNFLL